MLIPRLGCIEAQHFSPTHITNPVALRQRVPDLTIAQATFDHNIVALALDYAVGAGVIAANPLLFSEAS
ncbi:hypothetical protein ACFYV7_15070 [Nocardia suismassiliense]|uniref:Uncharacterized protein n=1 Tax=Nocardia suismassiliense TaxID=2077092 RepID=A0ABW6QSA0_9NOCA